MLYAVIKLLKFIMQWGFRTVKSIALFFMNIHGKWEYNALYAGLQSEEIVHLTFENRRNQIDFAFMLYDKTSFHQE